MMAFPQRFTEPGYQESLSASTPKLGFPDTFHRSLLVNQRYTMAPPYVRRVLRQTESDDGYHRSSAQETIRLTYEFSQIPVHHDLQAGSPAKLTVNAPGNIYEQEADRVSEEIIRRAGSPHPESAGREQVNNTGPRRFFNEGFLSSAPGSSSPYGQPLDPGIRSFMEPRFGYDFSQIRVHTDSAAADSARSLGARAYTMGSHLVFGADQYTSTQDGVRLLAHELTHVVQQRGGGESRLTSLQEERNGKAYNLGDGTQGVMVRFASAPGVIQCAPDTKSPASAAVRSPAPKPTKPKHSLKVRVRITDGDRIQVGDKDKPKIAGVFASMPKELRKRLIGQVKGRLSFLSDEGFDVSVEFGQFTKSDLKIPGNIQVWFIDELYEATRPGEIMTKQYGYKRAAADAANKEFQNVTTPGPGEEFKETTGLTPEQIDDSVPGTSEPVFVKIPSIFSRDELWHYKEGKKEEAELGVDEISATLSHELGHVLRSEVDDKGHATHAKGNFNKGKQTLPPRLMDTIGGRGGFTMSEGFSSPRLSTAHNDELSKEAIEKLGGMSSVWMRIILPNFGDDNLIRDARITDDGGLQVWYNFRNIGYTSDEQSNMIEFLKGIEMSEQNKKWKR